MVSTSTVSIGRLPHDAAEVFNFENYARIVAAYYGLPDITIRRSRPADFGRLTEIQVGALCASGLDFYGADPIKRYVERHLRQTRALCSTTTFYVAVSGREVVASGGWTSIKTKSRDIPCAVSFFVDPRHARRGIGRSLLAVTEATAKQAGIGLLSAFAPLQGTTMFRNSGYSAGKIVSLDLGDHYSLDLLALRKELTF